MEISPDIVLTGLVSALGFMVKAAFSEIKKRLDKQDERFDKFSELVLTHVLKQRSDP